MGHQLGEGHSCSAQGPTMRTGCTWKTVNNMIQTDKILKRKSLTTPIPTWLHTQDKKYLTTLMEAENIQKTQVLS